MRVVCVCLVGAGHYAGGGAVSSLHKWEAVGCVCHIVLAVSVSVID